MDSSWFIEASYITYKNWQDGNASTISFLSNIDYRHSKTEGGFRHNHYVRAELGYLQFLDSIWTKGSDFWRIGLGWTEKGNKIAHSYFALVSSQFLNTYRYVPVDENKLKREWRGGVFNPARIEGGYGMMYYFWQRCSLNVAFATMRVSVQPRYSTSMEPEKDHLIIMPHSYIISEYGFSSQLYLFKYIGKDERILWDNISMLFFNGIDKTHINFNIQNRIGIKLYKFLQLRIDSRMIYDPYFSTKPQFRQEGLLGFFMKREAIKMQTLH